jgi:acyl-CoA synthetase (AMP-forming)/AMP-acid ligase II
VSEQQIIDWAREHMAAYKAPRIVQFADSLPKSGTGKVMWRALQEEAMAKAEVLALRAMAERLEQNESRPIAINITLPLAA